MSEVCEHGHLARKCPHCENHELTVENNALTARVAELERSQDDPSADGTENAHPAYWRGHEDARRAAELLTKEAPDG